MGQDLGSRLGKAFEAYKERRLAPILQRYLDIFREQLQQAIKNEEGLAKNLIKAQACVFGHVGPKMEHKFPTLDARNRSVGNFRGNY